MDGYGFWSASARFDSIYVTESAGDRLGSLFFTGRSSVVYETRSEDVLDMYNVRHQ